jgi:hypothetical protein
VTLPGAGLLPTPIIHLHAVAPDARFVAVDKPINGGSATTSLVATTGHTEYPIGTGWFPLRWSQDGKLLYVEVTSPGDGSQGSRTVAVHLDDGGLPTRPLLPLPADSQLIPYPEESVAAGPDPSVYVYIKSELRRNIYRIPLH